MTPIHEYVSAHGAIIRPHPATEPAPGGAGLVVVTPSDTWRSLDEHRSDTTVALLAAPDLARGEFMPTVIGTVSVIEPAVPATAPDRTVLFQIHATTPADRIDVHESGLRAVEVRSQ